MVNMNQALGEDTVSQSTVSRWFRRFASWNSSFEDEERSGRPVELEDDDLLREVKACPDSTTRKLAQSLGFMHSAVQSRLHALGYPRVLARWTPHALTPLVCRFANLCYSNRERSFLNVLSPWTRTVYFTKT